MDEFTRNSPFNARLNEHRNKDAFQFWGTIGEPDTAQVACVIVGLLLGMSLTAAAYEVQSVRTTGESFFFGRHGTRLWQSGARGWVPNQALRRGYLIGLVGLCLLPFMPGLIAYEVFLIVYRIFLWCWVLIADAVRRR